MSPKIRTRSRSRSVKEDASSVIYVEPSGHVISLWRSLVLKFCVRRENEAGLDNVSDCLTHFLQIRTLKELHSKMMSLFCPLPVAFSSATRTQRWSFNIVQAHSYRDGRAISQHIVFFRLHAKDEQFSDLFPQTDKRCRAVPQVTGLVLLWFYHFTQPNIDSSKLASLHSLWRCKSQFGRSPLSRRFWRARTKLIFAKDGARCAR